MPEGHSDRHSLDLVLAEACQKGKEAPVVDGKLPAILRAEERQRKQGETVAAPELPPLTGGPRSETTLRSNASTCLYFALRGP
jgi:hypothetical protein